MADDLKRKAVNRNRSTDFPELELSTYYKYLQKKRTELIK